MCETGEKNLSKYLDILVRVFIVRTYGVLFFPFLFFFLLYVASGERKEFESNLRDVIFHRLFLP